jgi:hypothetical protein
MKAYGLPRDKDIEWPDVGSIQHYGLASHVGKFQERSGVYKPYIRSAEKRNAIRRHFKRIERMAAKSTIRFSLSEI